MTVQELLTVLTSGFFLLLGVLTLSDYLRHREAIKRDIALAFGVIAFSIAVSLIRRVISNVPLILSTIASLALIAQPYLLLRLVRYLQPVATFFQRLAFAGMLISWACLLIFGSPLPLLATLVIVGYFVVVNAYVMVVFIRGTRITSGVVQRRLQLCAIGSGLFALALLLTSVAVLIPGLRDILAPLTQFSAIFSAIAFLLGIVPPRWLRRMWQFAELRDYLVRVNQATISKQQITSILTELAQTANRAVGGFIAVVLDESGGQQQSHILYANDELKVSGIQINDASIVQHVRQTKAAVYITKNSALATTDRSLLERIQAATLIIVPINMQEHVLAMLLVFLRHRSLFPDDDLELLKLLAQQTAIVSENVQLIEQLRQSEEKFAKAFWASPAAISITSLPEGRWIEINDALANMTGYSREELLGHTSAELNLVDGVARAKILETIREHSAVRDVEIQLHSKSKGMVDVLLSTEQIQLNGQDCVLTIQYDITALKQAEREVRRLNADLEKRQLALENANKELEAFSYSVSHDLRAPLRAMDGFSQALLEDYHERLDDDGREYLELIRFESQRMGQLIDDLIGLSRYTRSELRRERVDLSAIAYEEAGRVQAQDPQRAVEFKIEDNLIVCGDSHLLQVVMQNLVGNAWKYSSKQLHTRIEFGCLQTNGAATYYVRDNGVGFDMAYVHKLFGAFQRLHGMTEFEGTGIGLATVQRIIHRHGGSIRAESAVNAGATFYFTLGQANCEEGDAYEQHDFAGRR